MNLPEFAVRRPITVFMLFIAVVLFGLLALMRLPVDLMPSFEFPMVSVVTLYPGAASEDIETNVTELIEDAVSTISGVEHVDSVSQTGISVIMVQFERGTDLNEASSDIRDLIDMLGTQLPSDIEAPMLMKMSSTNIPILMFGVTAEESFESLRHIVSDDIAEPLKAVPGVAEVMVLGGPEREIQVNIDPGRLEALGIPMEQIASVLAAENLDIPAGDVKLGWIGHERRPHKGRNLHIARRGHWVVPDLVFHITDSPCSWAVPSTGSFQGYLGLSKSDGGCSGGLLPSHSIA